MPVLVVIKVVESLLVSLHILGVEGELGFLLLLGEGAAQNAGCAAQETGDPPGVGGLVCGPL